VHGRPCGHGGLGPPVPHAARPEPPWIRRWVPLAVFVKRSVQADPFLSFLSDPFLSVFVVFVTRFCFSPFFPFFRPVFPSY
jgi:hypothetical protein